MGLLALAAVRRKHTVSKYFNNFYGITLKQEYIWIFFKLKLVFQEPQADKINTRYKTFKKIFSLTGQFRK